MYGLYGLFFENCTDCTDFFWKCTDFCTDGFKKVLATLQVSCLLGHYVRWNKIIYIFSVFLFKNVKILLFKSYFLGCRLWPCSGSVQSCSRDDRENLKLSFNIKYLKLENGLIYNKKQNVI